ncbi:MAG: protein kinase [Kiritimatiellia bacterium]|jgi:TPR repeat protein/serine/threonine protein kinase
MTATNQADIISDLQRLNVFDRLTPYGHQQLAPTFKGWHKGLRRQVIIRLLPVPRKAMDAMQRRELNALANRIIHFHHQGILKWLEFEEIALHHDRFYCLISEWFSDESLKDWLIQYGPLSEENAILTAKHVAPGLAHYWHRCHIAHGNLKPGNILINSEGKLRVDKFGLTTLLTLMREDVGVGTPAFMAPELITEGATPNDLSDIYALGTTLSCLLTGLLGSAQSESHMQTNPPLRTPLSREMDEIIRHMTAARPQDRFSSWEAVREAIQRYAQSHAISSGQSRKIQPIRIPIGGKNLTGMFGAANSTDAKDAGVSKASTHIIPAPPRMTPKIKAPIAYSPVQHNEKRILPQNKLSIVAAAACLVLIGAITMWALHAARNADAPKPLHARNAPAHSRDMPLAGNDDWDSLPDGAGRLSTSSRQALAIRTAAPATNAPLTDAETDTSKTGATPQMLLARDETNADVKAAQAKSEETGPNESASAGRLSQSGTIDHAEEGRVSDQPIQQLSPPSPSFLSQPVKGDNQENLSARIQAPSVAGKTTDASRVAAPGDGTADRKLAVLLKEAETGDVEVQCTLGDYYASINDQVSAFKWYQRAAEGNLARALCKYGDCLMTGRGTRTDELAAIEAYKKAAEQHDEFAQYKLADCYLKGRYVPRNPRMAVQLFQSAASNNHAEAWYYLGACALDGTGMIKSPKQALAYFNKAAELNYSPAYCRMAAAYAEGLFGKTNQAMALTMYTKAAEMNNIEAQGKLVTYYLSNKKNATQERDGAELNRWLKSAVTNTLDAAGNDDKKILVRLYVIYGDCLTDGLFMRKDLYEAAIWYEKAARAKDLDALYKYGLCLLNGTGVQKDETEAFNLFIRATAQNHAKSAWLAGECCLDGRGVNQDSIQAAKWFIKAANQNVPEAQYRMGECCMDGNGVTANAQDAFLWFLKSAEAGYEPAIEKVIECYQKGIGAKKSKSNAMAWHSKLLKSEKAK